MARRAAELGHQPEAAKAYYFALTKRDDEPLLPAERLEAAVFLLETGEEYHIPYDELLSLFAEGMFHSDIFPLLLGAFYEPNEKDLKRTYERNVKLLSKYPYLFRKDFPSFEDLPLVFFPYDDDVYIPFDPASAEFLPKVEPRDRRICHWFFRDLSKPILANDIFSQYELEYLVDNVRASEDVGYENHVYLHYQHWEVFCAYLQVLNLYPLLQKNKLVFLIEDELKMYPIDFKARFHLDYSKYPPHRVRISEITRIILHAQLSTHNGGDFFNRICLISLRSCWINLSGMRERSAKVWRPRRPFRI